eukprot:Awhi_evm13s12155
MNFNDFLNVHLSKNKDDEIKQHAESSNSVIHNDNDLTKQDLEVYKKYGLLPHQLKEIEDELNLSLEKVYPRRMDGKELKKEKKTLGLDPKLKNHLDKYYLMIPLK